MSNQKESWVSRVHAAFIEELAGQNVPEHESEVMLQQKIFIIVQFRANGLDHRKIGCLAADIYRLAHGVRERVIEDIAKVAASVTDGE